MEVDYGRAVAIDTVGDIIVGGQTYGSLGRRRGGGADAFVVKYSPEGAVKWRRQPGSARWEDVTGLATDLANNILVVGYTNGAVAGPNRGLDDGFVVKYAADGTVQWKRQVGAKHIDMAFAVVADAVGNIVVVGMVDFVSTCCDTGDAFVIKYAPDGTEQWRRVLDSSKWDQATGIATDAAGNIVIVGSTYGCWEEPIRAMRTPSLPPIQPTAR
jgi:hypothetical protein